MDMKLDARSDLFSLAATVYSLLTGEYAIRRLQRHEPLWQEDCSIHPLFCEIIEESLHFNPEDRFQSAEKMRKAILSMADHDGTIAGLRRLRTMISITSAVLVIAGAGMCARGIQERRAEEFQNACTQATLLASEDRDSEAARRALEILNNGLYRSAMRSNPGQKADLLYIIANDSFEKEEYSNSLRFYEQAIDADPSNPDYFRDYAIANARTGEIKKAEEIITNAGQYGLRDDDLYLIQAEISLKQGDADSAVQNFLMAIQTSGSDELKCRASILCGDAYRTLQRWDEGIALLKDSGSRLTDPYHLRLQRALGSFYIRAIEATGNTRTDYIEGAVQCYEELTGNPAAAIWSDWLNLTALWETLGDFNRAQGVLLQAEQQFPERYEFPCRYALDEIRCQNLKKTEERNYQHVLQYYQKAEALYKPYKIEGRSDESMKQLEDAIDELRKEGWLT